MKDRPGVTVPKGLATLPSTTELGGVTQDGIDDLVVRVLQIVTGYTPNEGLLALVPHRGGVW